MWYSFYYGSVIDENDLSGLKVNLVDSPPNGTYIIDPIVRDGSAIFSHPILLIPSVFGIPVTVLENSETIEFNISEIQINNQNYFQLLSQRPFDQQVYVDISLKYKRNKAVEITVIGNFPIFEDGDKIILEEDSFLYFEDNL